MAINDKIKALLRLQGKSMEQLAQALDLRSTQALYNKLNRNSFSGKDLIRIAAYLDCDLEYVTKDGQRIVFSKGDIED